ncbi:hypothetical protein A4A49_18859 [Nicotiana attenuata]|uniref:Uncharacterized protein n=1 Tax=Nicotiana attenuata TaxID=49451 RepID=A0A314KUY1_NICAT|nr:hypothetical protein A4A49_18859 [Nicotiana attenuata]
MPCLWSRIKELDLENVPSPIAYWCAKEAFDAWVGAVDRNCTLKQHWLLNGGSESVHEQVGQPEGGAIGHEIVDDIEHLSAVEVVNEVDAQTAAVGLEKTGGGEPGWDAADTVAPAHGVVNEVASDRAEDMAEAE